MTKQSFWGVKGTTRTPYNILNDWCYIWDNKESAEEFINTLKIIKKHKHEHVIIFHIDKFETVDI